MAAQTWVELFAARTTDGVSASFSSNGSSQGIYVVGVMDGATLCVEGRVPPEAPQINAPDTFVPVVNGEWRAQDMYPTEYTAGGNAAVGMMRTLNSVPGQYRVRLKDAGANTVLWVYMTRS